MYVAIAGRANRRAALAALRIIRQREEAMQKNHGRKDQQRCSVVQKLACTAAKGMPLIQQTSVHPSQSSAVVD
jgi:hypothetical protein